MAVRIDTVMPGQPFGDGADGDVTISTTSTHSVANTGCNGSSGSPTLNVTSVSGFVANDLVYIHQTQGSNAGLCEFARIQSVGASSFTLYGNLTNSYSNSGSNKAQVLKVKRYNNFTINAGVTYSVPAWDGTTGGLMVIAVRNIFTYAGIINGVQKGFVGGTARFPGEAGEQGDSSTGVRTASTSANGPGGGGGSFVVDNQRKGGGGAGHASSGTNGGYVGTAAGYGIGGSTDGNAALTDFNLGSGGGGGSGEVGTSGGGYGGRGSGSFHIAAKKITQSGAGALTLDGQAGESNTDKGGGGGGAGGGGILQCHTGSVGTNTVTALAGAGGDGNSTADGGNGSAGRIRIEYGLSLSGTTNPSASAVQDVTLFEPAGASLLALI